MECHLFSKRFKKYIKKRSNYLILKLLKYKYKQLQVCHNLILLYYDVDRVYEQRRVTLLMELTLPTKIYVKFRHKDNTFAVIRYDVVIVLRCLAMLIQREILPQRYIKLVVAHHMVTDYRNRCITFDRNMIYIGEAQIDMNMPELSMTWDFADILNIPKRKHVCYHFLQYN